MKKLILLVVVVLSLFLSCKKEEATYKLNATEVSLTIRETFQFIITKGKTQYNISEFEVNSSNIPIGRMSASGLFTAENRGKTTLTVETETSTLRCEITVK
ncbi:hypothetical protein [Pedobacter ginsengisoli]|uniref:hypothetical protein n=1 Tax=Pedobacter ginsengisoli TaxID=363852 RepID=UPI00254F6ED2|nr:hypothetical protein [Pedobacter ginsengisoli]